MPEIALPLLYAAGMIYRFDTFELDLAKLELRADDAVRPVEPQVFSLLALLVGNRERVVSRDEIIENVWDGRVVSDSAIDSRIKSARQALGDDGTTQRFIKTIHRKGFRFVADARVVGSGSVALAGAAEASAAPAGHGARPSIAVLPFRHVGVIGPYATLADALPHELISDLARLHWLFVTARESSFRLRGAEADPGEIGRLLDVHYYLAGSVEMIGNRLAVMVELIDTRDGGIVWAEHFAVGIQDVHQLREDIRAQTLAALEIRIPLHEASIARLSVSENLDAWSAYHRGLQHMYRFNRTDNAAALALFQQSIARDPGFARAHAGLSFVHFQSAFMHHTDDVAGEVALSRQFATRGLELDPIDPFVNFAMGRSFWLEGDLQSSLGWLERATTISPNYAQGIYARAWAESLAERSIESRKHVDLAMRLSPLDPLHYAMVGTRAFIHMMQGEDAEAADWAERAARAPGAHVLIAMIAIAAHALAGDTAKATAWAANVRARNPALGRNDFFRAFPMQSATMRARASKALATFEF
ncbi:winged helix-turn-helix domain-containing protein [Thermomonas sp.]|uniref:winged helix-turn-helix domain-containing tetratricopeptide repeat protein n=1 Tax=Thermomonas sp. TaxID=1971895 RepID=UPI002488CDBF|nr:winged helix-turn-helix domain-containing protein [Thermomonas sp.]MDI1253062.1 winged helix-turn-helix domain-containing protein [Thermomonas sp.]